MGRRWVRIFAGVFIIYIFLIDYTGLEASEKKLEARGVAEQFCKQVQKWLTANQLLTNS